MKIDPAERAALMARLTVISGMMKGEGYKIFEQVLKDTAAAAYHSALNAKESLEMAKHMGALKVANDLQSWAEREIRICTQRLQEGLDK